MTTAIALTDTEFLTAVTLAVGAMAAAIGWVARAYQGLVARLLEDNKHDREGDLATAMALERLSSQVAALAARECKGGPCNVQTSTAK